MRIREFRNMTTKELVAKLISLKKEVMNLRFRKASAALTDTSKIKEAKRNVARINTIIVEKRSAAKQAS